MAIDGKGEIFEHRRKIAMVSIAQFFDGICDGISGFHHKKVV
jgi:hypothetical protein